MDTVLKLLYPWFMCKTRQINEDGSMWTKRSQGTYYTLQPYYGIGTITEEAT